MLTPRLAAIVAEYVPTSRGGLGGAERETAKALREHLFEDYRATSRTLYVALAMVVAVFLVMLYLLAINAGSPRTFYFIAGASGLSITGLIWMVIRIAREMSQGGLLVILAERLPAEDALEAMRCILKSQQPVTTDFPKPGLESK